jgi:hypothetical protein
MILKRVVVGAIIGFLISIIAILTISDAAAGYYGARGLGMRESAVILGTIGGAFVGPFARSLVGPTTKPFWQISGWAIAGVVLGFGFEFSCALAAPILGACILPIAGGIIGAFIGTFAEEADPPYEFFKVLLVLLALGVVGFLLLVGLVFVGQVQKLLPAEATRQALNRKATAHPFDSVQATQTAGHQATATARAEAIKQAVAEARSVGRIFSRQYHIRNAVFSPNGRELAATALEVRMWDIETLTEITTLFEHNGHNDWITGADYSRDGSKLATIDRSGVIKIWDMHTRQMVSTLNGMASEYNQVHFSPDGQSVLADQEYQLTGWNVNTGQELYTVALGRIRRAIITPYSPDGHYILAVSTSVMNGSQVYVRDASTGQEIAVLGGDKQIGIANVVSAGFSPNGHNVLIARYSGAVEIWDIATRKQISHFQAHQDLNCAKYSPDGRTIVTASDDQTAKIWDATTVGKQVATLYPGGEVTLATYSPDGRYILTMTSKDSAAVWDVDALQAGGEFKAE